MPSSQILESKKAIVADLAAKIKESSSGVIVNYAGITVENDTKLRAELRKADVEYKVYKNTLTGRACSEAGYEALAPQLEGMTAIAVSKDPVAPAKILCSYADKIETFEVKGGYIDGEVIDAAKVKELAAIPSKEALVCKIMGSMMSPLYGLAYALQAIIDKQGGAEAPEAAPAE